VWSIEGRSTTPAEVTAAPCRRANPVLMVMVAVSGRRTIVRRWMGCYAPADAGLYLLGPDRYVRCTAASVYNDRPVQNNVLIVNDIQY